MTVILLIGGVTVSGHALLIVTLGVSIVVRFLVQGYCELSGWWRPFCIVCELSNIVALGCLLFTRIVLGLLVVGVVGGSAGIPRGGGKVRSAVGEVLGVFAANFTF